MKNNRNILLTNILVFNLVLIYYSVTMTIPEHTDPPTI